MLRYRLDELSTEVWAQHKTLNDTQHQTQFVHVYIYGIEIMMMCTLYYVTPETEQANNGIKIWFLINSFHVCLLGDIVRLMMQVLTHLNEMFIEQWKLQTRYVDP